MRYFHFSICSIMLFYKFTFYSKYLFVFINVYGCHRAGFGVYILTINPHLLSIQGMNDKQLQSKLYHAAKDSGSKQH